MDINKKIILKVGSFPFFNPKTPYLNYQRNLLLALTPIVLMSLIRFTWSAFIIYFSLGIIFVLSEFIYSKIKKNNKIEIISAIINALLLGSLLPNNSSFFLIIISAVSGLIFAKSTKADLGLHPISAPIASYLCFLLLAKFGSHELEFLNTLKVCNLNNLKFSYQYLLFNPESKTLGASQTLAVLGAGLYLALCYQSHFKIIIFFLTGLFVASFILSFNLEKAFTSTLITLLTANTAFGLFFFLSHYFYLPLNRRALMFYGFFSGLLLIILQYYNIFTDNTLAVIVIAKLSLVFLNPAKPKLFGA